jgi:hypothetical protein
MVASTALARRLDGLPRDGKVRRMNIPVCGPDGDHLPDQDRAVRHPFTGPGPSPNLGAEQGRL